MAILYWTYSRGHKIHTENGKDWVYSDTKEPFIDNRPCKKCGLSVNEKDPDPCLGMLPDVTFACCGHGVEGQDYVVHKGVRLSLNEYNLIIKK